MLHIRFSNAIDNHNAECYSQPQLDIVTSGLTPRVCCPQETQEHLSEVTTLKEALAAAQQRVSGTLIIRIMLCM